MVTTACRIFLWTSYTKSSRKSLVARETLCLPRSVGGLKIIEFESQNRVYICKLLWDLSHKKETLRAQWIHNSYIKNRELTLMETPKQACWLVRKIFDARKQLTNSNSVLNIQVTDVGLSTLRNFIFPLFLNYQR